MSNEIVITGLGSLTACGHDVEATWSAIKNNESGIREIEAWDTEKSPFKYMAAIKDFNPRKMIHDRKLLRVLSKQDVIGLHAAQQAIEHSGIVPYRDSLNDPTEFNERTGMYVGSPGNKFTQQYDFLPLLSASKSDLKIFADKLFETVHPMWLLRILPNNVLAYVGINNQFKGPNQNITNHAVSGTQSIIEAVHDLREGVIDRAVVVAYDTECDPHNLKYYESLGLLSSNGLNAFDARHDGTILGEGAGALILETKGAVRARGANVIAEIVGGASTCEAKGVMSVRDDGCGLSRAIENALKQANMTPGKVGMVVGHANGTQQSDKTEAAAIRNVFGDNAVPVTGFKWALGHTLSAAGAIETVLAVKAMSENIVPGLVPFKDIASECEGLSLSSAQRDLQHPSAMVITRAFGSLNSCLLLRKVFQSC